MAGSKEVGPSSRLVAANLRRIRQERGLSYAELARRLATLGHPVADTALLKTEKGDRRASVDDLVAFAIALGTTPNRLLLPAADSGPADGEPASWGKEPPSSLWAWATGEVPLGHRPVSAGDGQQERITEMTFSRESRQQHWIAPALPAASSDHAAAARDLAVTGLVVLIQAAFAVGLTTADIRAVVEGALMRALMTPMDALVPVRFEAGEGRVTIFTGPPDSPGAQEEQ